MQAYSKQRGHMDYLNSKLQTTDNLKEKLDDMFVNKYLILMPACRRISNICMFSCHIDPILLNKGKCNNWTLIIFPRISTKLNTYFLGNY